MSETLSMRRALMPPGRHVMLLLRAMSVSSTSAVDCASRNQLQLRVPARN